jgi:hypothetical protein
MPVIQALRGLKQEDHKFEAIEASLSYTLTACLKNNYSYNKISLINSGCPNKIPRTDGLNSKHSFSPDSED